VILALSAYAQRPVGSLENGSEYFDQFTERLALSQQQAEQIRPILQHSREKQRLLRDKYQEDSRSPSTLQSFRKEREELRQEIEKRLAAVLSQEQMREYRKMQGEEREKMRKGYGSSRGRSRR